MINGFLGRVLCCLLPLGLVGLFGIGIGGYGLITGKGGSRIDSMGQKSRSGEPAADTRRGLLWVGRRLHVYHDRHRDGAGAGVERVWRRDAVVT